jgi:O-antigen/teichoic acid export membrane protein
MNRPVERVWLSTVVINAMILVVGIGTGILVSRTLEPMGRGALAAVLFWPQMLLSVGMCSLQEAVTYRVSQTAGEPRSLCSTTLWLSLALAALTGLFGYFLLPLLMRQDRLEWLPLVRSYLLFFIPIGFLSVSLVAVELGYLRVNRYNLYHMVNPVTYLAALACLWLFHAVTVTNVVWANLAGTVSVTALVLWQLRREFRSRPAVAEFRQLLGVAWRFHTTALLVIATTQIDRFVVIELLDDRQVGLYAAALTFAGSGLSILSSSFHTLMFPTIARKDAAAQGDYLATGLRYAMFLIVAFSVPLVLVMPWLLPLLFGKAFSAAVVPSIFLVVAYIPLALRQIIVRSLRGLNDPAAGTKAEALSIVIFLASAWPLTAHFQLLGVAGALLLANLCALGYLTWYLAVRLSIAPARWWGLNSRTILEAFGRIRNAFPNPLTRVP